MKLEDIALSLGGVMLLCSLFIAGMAVGQQENCECNKQDSTGAYIDHWICHSKPEGFYGAVAVNIPGYPEVPPCPETNTCSDTILINCSKVKT